jgi:hypothetical protein
MLLFQVGGLDKKLHSDRIRLLHPLLETGDYRFDLLKGEAGAEFYFHREQHLLGAELHREQIGHTFDRGIRGEYFSDLLKPGTIGPFTGKQRAGFASKQ